MPEDAIIAHGVEHKIFAKVAEAKQHLAFKRSCAGHGAIGMKKAMCAYWHLCQGKTKAEIMTALRIGESTVTRLQYHALGAIWLDALQLQSEKNEKASQQCRVRIESNWCI